ncbi:cytochrome c [Halioxenophilus sp. WMMB6]|uniref:c-type cytochrome n=1 Tax=Halioxenophilus sp. WMMB6 TaxID=3073815 RepID=UPI00295E8458|nr:cytochrome c [Halioxenophilus sp. WMMB6]
MMLNKRKLAGFPTALVMAGGLLASAATCFAASDMESLIDERQQGFKAMGKGMKALNKGLKADELNLAELAAAASAIADNAGKIDGWFPAGSGMESGVETEALDYIWKNNSKFTSITADMVTAAKALLAATEGGDAGAIQNALGEAGKSCKACHNSFRED